MASRILGFCFAVFVGAILLTLALELLAAIWGWLVLIGAIILALVLGIRIWQWRRDQW